MSSFFTKITLLYTSPPFYMTVIRRTYYYNCREAVIVLSRNLLGVTEVNKLKSLDTISCAPVEIRIGYS